MPRRNEFAAANDVEFDARILESLEDGSTQLGKRIQGNGDYPPVLGSNQSSCCTSVRRHLTAVKTRASTRNAVPRGETFPRLREGLSQGGHGLGEYIREGTSEDRPGGCVPREDRPSNTTTLAQAKDLFEARVSMVI